MFLNYIEIHIEIEEKIEMKNNHNEIYKLVATILKLVNNLRQFPSRFNFNESFSVFLLFIVLFSLFSIWKVKWLTFWKCIRQRSQVGMFFVHFCV